MKLVNKACILLMLLLLAKTSLANEQNNDRQLISIQATRYDISFQNISKHSLRVIVRDRNTYKSQFFLLNPGQTSNFTGNFDKQRLLDLEVMSVYDLLTFQEDIKRFSEKILFKNKHNPTKTLQIKRSDWYQFVTNYVDHKDVSAYLEDFDFAQPTIRDRTAKELASDIAGKITKDRAIISDNGNGYFAGTGLSASKAAVAVVLELAYNAAEFGYKKQIPYLRSMLEWLSDKRFIQSNRDLIFHKADGLDLRTSTPTFSISFSPIFFTQNLNDSWLAPNEVGFEPNRVIGNGWFNNTLQLQGTVMVSPEFNILPNIAYSRIYASLIYQRISYELNPGGVYELSTDYLRTVIPTPDTTYAISDLDGVALRTTGLGLSMSVRTMIKDLVFIDIEGGFLNKRTRFDFSQGEAHFLDVPEVAQITYDNRRVLENYLSAFGKIKAGVGYNTQKSTGIYIYGGFGAFQNEMVRNEDYKLYLRRENSSDLVPTTSKSWLLSVDFGIEVMF